MKLAITEIECDGREIPEELAGRIKALEARLLAPATPAGSPEPEEERRGAG
jgi:hypothetical protein